jgi:hypothetical protein
MQVETLKRTKVELYHIGERLKIEFHFSKDRYLRLDEIADPTATFLAPVVISV